MKGQAKPLPKATDEIQELTIENAEMNEINWHRILVAVYDEKNTNTMKVNFQQQNYKQVEFFGNNELLIKKVQEIL